MFLPKLTKQYSNAPASFFFLVRPQTIRLLSRCIFNFPKERARCQISHR
jgi:hypothetical protein